MLMRNQNRPYFFYFRIMKRTQTRYFQNDRAKCLRGSGGDKKEFRCSVNEVVNASLSANLLKRQMILRASVGKATASLGVSVRPSVHPSVRLVDPTLTLLIFAKIRYLGFVLNCVHPLRFWLQSEKIHFTSLPTCICGCSL
jgi:hypothetical protein